MEDDIKYLVENGFILSITGRYSIGNLNIERHDGLWVLSISGSIISENVMGYKILISSNLRVHLIPCIKRIKKSLIARIEKEIDVVKNIPNLW